MLGIWKPSRLVSHWVTTPALPNRMIQLYAPRKGGHMRERMMMTCQKVLPAMLKRVIRYAMGTPMRMLVMVGTKLTFRLLPRA